MMDRVYARLPVASLPDELLAKIRACKPCRANGGKSTAVWACDEHSIAVALAYRVTITEITEPLMEMAHA